MQRRINFSEGEFYHIYNRGANKTNIFLDHFDRARFQKLLLLCNRSKAITFRDYIGRSYVEIEKEEPLVDIGVYCLMPNHFHLLLRERTENGISIFMKKVLTSYSMYFNTKYEHSGVLFQGRFGARHADSDEYLKYLFAYIHLNPVKIIDPDWKENGIKDREKAKGYLSNYPYSSYLEYTGEERPEGCILNKEAFPEYFSHPQDFDIFIEDWLSFSEE